MSVDTPPCAHRDLRIAGEFVHMPDLPVSEGRLRMVVLVRCGTCGIPFHFLGPMPTDGNFFGPMINADGMRLTIPIVTIPIAPGPRPALENAGTALQRDTLLSPGKPLGVTRGSADAPKRHLRSVPPIDDSESTP